MIKTKKLLIFSGLLLILIAWFFFPKKARLNYRDSACFSDRCFGFAGERPACHSSHNNVENCYNTCYGYVYNKCDNRSIPIDVAGKILDIFGIQWSGSWMSQIISW